MDGQTRVVLLIVDDREEATMYALGLEREGFRVVTHVGATPELADADVVVVNDTGNGGPGWTFLERLCGDPASPPAVLVTAYIRADRAIRDRVASLGCAAYVTKPCTPTTLAAILRRVLDGERGIEEISPK